jgi:hypothetical protein
VIEPNAGRHLVDMVTTYAVLLEERLDVRIKRLLEGLLVVLGASGMGNQQ